jgi:PPM family protein phosphatase
MSLRLTYAARSDVGLLRDGNEDSGYAGPHLLAVADGMGGAAAGEVASSVVIAAYARLDDEEPSGDLLAALEDTMQYAEGQLSALVETEPGLTGMGTTLTAIIRSGTRLGLVHVGDSRGYLLRNAKLERLTRDHTLVQSLIDAGRLREEDARTHPQRAVLTRVLDGSHPVEPDLSMREMRIGDRFLLCSDGLCGVVTDETIESTLTEYADPDEAADALIGLALRGGGPDNITCVVADVVDVDDDDDDENALVVGAVGVQHNSRRLRLPDTPAGRAARLTQQSFDTSVDPRRRPRRMVILLALAILAVGMLLGAMIGWYVWAQQQYYVGAADSDSGDGQVVAIYRGPAEQLFGLQLSRVVETSPVTFDSLPEFEQDQVSATIPARSLEGAQEIVDRLSDEVARCGKPNAPSGCPTP